MSLMDVSPCSANHFHCWVESWMTDLPHDRLYHWPNHGRYITWLPITAESWTISHMTALITGRIMDNISHDCPSRPNHGRYFTWLPLSMAWSWINFCRRWRRRWYWLPPAWWCPAWLLWTLRLPGSVLLRQGRLGTYPKRGKEGGGNRGKWGKLWFFTPFLYLPLYGRHGVQKVIVSTTF